MKLIIILNLFLFLFLWPPIKAICSEESVNTDYDIPACQNLSPETEVELLQCLNGKIAKVEVELPDSIKDLAEVQTRMVADEGLITLKQETVSFLEESETTLKALQACQLKKDQDLNFSCEDQNIESMLSSIRNILPQMRLHLALSRDGKDRIPLFGDQSKDTTRNFVSKRLVHTNTGGEIPPLSKRELAEAETLFRHEVGTLRNQYLAENDKLHCLELHPDRGIELISKGYDCNHVTINNSVNTRIPLVRRFHEKEYEKLRDSFPFLAYINMKDPGDEENFSENLYAMITESLTALGKEKHRVSSLTKKRDLENLFSYRVPASRAISKLENPDVKAYMCKYAQDHLDYLYNINLATDIGIGIAGVAGALACGATVLCGAAVGIGTEAILLARQNNAYNGTLDSFRLGLVEADQVEQEKDALNLTIALTPVMAVGGEVVSSVGARLFRAGKQRLGRLVAELRRPTRTGNVDPNIVLHNAALDPDERLKAAAQLLGLEEISPTSDLGKALLEAHDIGGPLASVFRYTDEELSQKLDILISAGYTPTQAKNLIRHGLAGKKGGGLFRSIASAFKSKSTLERLQESRNALSGPERTALETEVLNENGLGPVLQLFSREQGTQARLREAVIPLIESQDRDAMIALERLQNLPGEDIRFLLTEGGFGASEAIDALRRAEGPETVLRQADTRAALKRITRAGNFEGAFDRFPINHLEREAFENDLLTKIFPDHLFPSGSVSINNTGNLIFSDNLSEEAIKFLEKMQPSWNQVIREVDSAATNPANRTRLMLERFGINDSALLAKLQRKSFGGRLDIPTRPDSWEQASTDDLLANLLGVRSSLDGANLAIDPENIPVEFLEQLSEAQTRIRNIDPSVTGSRRTVQAQEILNDMFYTPELVRNSLGARASLVPTNTSNLTHRSGGSEWQIIDFEELKTAASEPNIITAQGPKNTSRRVYRNSETGQSIVENLNPDGTVHSVEMIVARDPQDATQGVTFFSYEDGQLSRRFENSAHGNNRVGFDCMKCHGARDRNNLDNITSSFVPLGMGQRRINAYDRSMVHPSIEQLEVFTNSRDQRIHP